MSEKLEKQKRPEDGSDYRENPLNELLVAVSTAILNRIGPIVAGVGIPEELPLPLTEGFLWLRVTPDQVPRLLGSEMVETEVAVVVALFPAGVRALLATRVDASLRVSRSTGSLEASIAQCSEPEFLLYPLVESFDATDLLHLICDTGQDTGHNFVMVEFSGGKFLPKEWVDGAEARRYAADGEKQARGRGPDFSRTIGKFPR
jgi:hypothetical protein